MSRILLIAGSPVDSSRSSALIEHARRHLDQLGVDSTIVSVRDFPAEDLIQAKYDSPAFDAFKARIAAADAIVIATPIYKAAYTGALKALLDILPQNSLRGKTILPVATGGTIAHLLAIDYALKPVLSVLGASDIQQGVYIVDTQFQKTTEGYVLDAELQQRLDEGLERLAATMNSLVA